MYKLRRWSRTAMAIVALLTLIMSTAAAAPQVNSQSLSDRSTVRIIRDDYGVPHVHAPTETLLWYGFGYVQAQDRLWHADIIRRTATGTLAEILGPDSVEGDIAARIKTGSVEQRAAILAQATPENRAVIESFAAGFNAWIEQAKATNQLPIEYRAFGVQPRPWTPDDSIAILLFLTSRFGASGDTEDDTTAYFQELVKRFGEETGAAIFADTHWLNDPDAVTTIPASAAASAPAASAATDQATPVNMTLPTGFDSLSAQIDTAQSAWQQHLEQVGLTGVGASNAVLIGSELSADGSPLLLGGPQMGYTAPQINLEIGLHGAGYNLTGIAVVGAPWITIGATPRYAWTLTSGGTDNTDLYLETLNPENPRQYLFQDAWHDLDCREETIVVRGAAAVTETICESVHGPVIATEVNSAITRKLAARGLEMQSYAALRDMMKARSMADFDAALSRIAANFNVFYADMLGNIAYWHIGAIPIRAANDNPWLFRDGTGTAEWQGFIPWSEMPHIINPEQGWIGNWNNKPTADWNSAGVGFLGWGPVQRVNTLHKLLEQLEPGTATVETLAAINRTAGWTIDTPSGDAGPVFAPTLLDAMLAQVDTAADSRLPAIVALLQEWDWLQVDANGDGAYDSPAVAIFNTWWPAFTEHVFADDLGEDFDPYAASNVVYRLLNADTVLPVRHNYLGDESIAAALTNTMIESLDDLTAQYGSAAPDNWLQSIAVIEWTPVGVRTIPDTIWMNRGTYNQIIRMGKGRRFLAQNVIAPGQSGNPASPHFSDQLALYTSWTYKPMRITYHDRADHIKSVTILRP
ncbi:MAG: penicillin acylase family protein [Chloroflexales bacterium]|nr:penicillin acylase family protein [Chloroflexales bacterium]